MDSPCGRIRGKVRNMRSTIRKIATGLFFSGVGAIVFAVLGEWFVEVARDKGWYADAGKTWDLIMGPITEFATSYWIVVPMSVLGGVVIGLWADVAIRSISAHESNHQQTPENCGKDRSSWLEIYRRRPTLDVYEAGGLLAGEMPSGPVMSDLAAAYAAEIKSAVLSGEIGINWQPPLSVTLELDKNGRPKWREWVEDQFEEYRELSRLEIARYYSSLGRTKEVVALGYDENDPLVLPEEG
jgi:hypothetical protein